MYAHALSNYTHISHYTYINTVILNNIKYIIRYMSNKSVDQSARFDKYKWKTLIFFFKVWKDILLIGYSLWSSNLCHIYSLILLEYLRYFFRLNHRTILWHIFIFFFSFSFLFFSPPLKVVHFLANYYLMWYPFSFIYHARRTCHQLANTYKLSILNNYTRNPSQYLIR